MTTSTEQPCATNIVTKRSRASTEQLSQMVNFMINNTGLVGGKFKRFYGKFECDRKWAELSEILNTLGGAVKTPNQWQTVWKELKSRTSIKVRDRKRQQALTGNTQEPLSDLERRVITVIGNNYIEGNGSVVENVPMEENVIILEDGEEIASSNTEDTYDLQYDIPSTSKRTPRKGVKRKRADDDNETKKQFLAIANKQADALKMLAECSASNVETNKIMADAIKTLGEGLKEFATAIGSLGNTISKMFGVIVAFATNSYMQYGIDDSTSMVRAGSNDTQMFLQATSEQLEYVLVNNYKQLSDQLELILRETSDFIITQLEQKSMAVSVGYLTDFLKKLPDLRQKLQQMKLITNDLRVYASQLSDGLRGVKRDLLVMLNKCSHQSCKDVLNRYEIGKLDANGIHYDQLPDVTIIIENLEQLINDDIASAGERGNKALRAMRKHLNDTIAIYTPQIVDAITKAGQGLLNASNDIKAELQKVSKLIGTNTYRYTNIADNYRTEYGPYRFYMGISVCSILLLVLICLVAALLCGICGKRPDGYGDDCCNKGSGSRFLMFAVAIIFLTISAVTLIALIHFLIGIVAYRGVCVPLKDPQNDALFARYDNLIDLNEIMYPSKIKGKAASGKLPPFRISHVIAACQSNQTIYEVLHIKNLVDINEINEYPSHYKINQTLDNLVQGIDFDDKGVEILSASDKQRILSLRESALKDFDSSHFIDNLNDDITKHSLTEIAIQLRETAKKIISPDMKDVQVSLRNQALHLETYDQNLVIPMKNQSAELIKLAQDLDKTLSYKDRPFQDSIPLLVQEIERAQAFIQKDGRTFVKATAETFTNHFAGEIMRYLDMVITSVEKKIGICAPMARVYEAGVVATCNSIIDPLNGFWAGVFWCVILFLPTLVVAVKLSSLYQKSDPYPGPLVESEYLYDAYSERDHIPLANGPKNKRRKNKDRRRRDYYEDPVGSTSHGIPPAAAGARDTRYSDMAPKHWDGGPPRYQNPPMAPPASEYERPPPYYYPGASDQD